MFSDPRGRLPGRALLVLGSGTGWDRQPQITPMASTAMRAQSGSEGEELIERAQHNWNPSLPPPPDDLLSATTFKLRFEDADFLAEQIRHHAGDSLLARCLSPAIRRVKSAPAIWDLGGIETLDHQLHDISRMPLAGRFCLWMGPSP